MFVRRTKQRNLSRLYDHVARNRRNVSDHRPVKIDERNDKITRSRVARYRLKFHIWVSRGTEGRTPILICIGTSVMAEPATRESYTPSHNAASDALCMLHTLAMIRKITEGEERRGVDRLSSCTNDRDAVSTTLRVVPALQIDCVAKKRAWNRPRGSIRSAPRYTSTVPRTFQPARMQAMQLVSRLVPCFFFFSFPFSPSFPE